MANLIATEGIEAHALWCELVSGAAYKPETVKTPYGTIELQRGELLYSHRTVAERLGLTMSAVRSRVDRWARNGSIKKRPSVRTQPAHNTAHPPTIITIVEFDTYSPPPVEERTPECTENDISELT